ncbi:HIRAN domain-containing protein [Sphingomonas sp. RHCKR47]|uniref:HIRAN domain-containing protein n=1 Tax=Sphingomonas citricola TaxID=2862498 RepID=UPI001CA37266|nr:HIRAN domain-containing protein [Sphingomonas citricola]MBW6524452.1 HIRAN domain-containing protein [Sphingomonas citricola]
MHDELEYLRVVGVSFYQEAVARCSVGEAVRFVHEPDNPHDAMALRVVSLLGETIGYAPKRSWVHRVIHQQGRGVSAVVHSVGYSRSCILGVMLSMAVCDDDVQRASYYPGQACPEPPPGGFRYWISNPAAAGPISSEQR